MILKALLLARTSTCRARHAVVIAHGPKVLAVAVNRDRNHPSICANPQTEASTHAEVNALKQVEGLDMSNCTLYSARIHKNGTPAMAKPCVNCQREIDRFKFKMVIWTEEISQPCDT